MRHPQKDTSIVKTDDFDLQLSNEGIEDAHTMAKRLLNLQVHPDLIVASPALRTAKTAQIVAKELAYEKTIMYNEVLYQAFLNELLETISYTFDIVDELFIVGHNPSLATLAYSLVNFKEEFKPCMVLKIEFDCHSWIDIDKENARLVWVESI
jgi:phosphohistidine phosphatase